MLAETSVFLTFRCGHMSVRVRWVTRYCVAGFAAAAALGGTTPASSLPIDHDVAKGPPQYVVISFDGAGSLRKWRDTLAFARETRIKFTYFLSCTFFLHRGNRRLYKPPRRRAGRSNIGFAMTAAEVEERLSYVNQAITDGHEIASHGCGHFNGRRWSEAAWRKEFASFRSILRNAYRNNSLKGEPADWKVRIDGAVKGFRAPYLASGRALDRALGDAGFRYDASRVGRRGERPSRSRSGHWLFRLAMIPEGRRNRSIISMDYNFYVRHSKARSDPARRKVYARRMLRAYMNYFNHNYRNGRQPVHIGHHFSYWNGAAYWTALKAFAQKVCGRRDVRCVSYTQLADALDRERPRSGHSSASYRPANAMRLPSGSETMKVSAPHGSARRR